MQKAHKRQTTKLFPLRKIKDLYRGRQSEVVQAHNAFVEAKNQGHTGSQIYLWGDGRVFKSTLSRSIYSVSFNSFINFISFIAFILKYYFLI